MKRYNLPPAYSLWILLALALVIFVGVSLWKDINIGSYTLTKARFQETLFAEGKELQIETPLPPDTLSVEQPLIVEPDTTVHNVLVFGDSMTHHLAMSIAKYGTKNHYKVTGVTWESSSIPGWSSSGKVKEYIEQVKPDFIFISLGANEMELKHFDRRIPDIRKIIEQIDTIPYIWVGPPLWKEDKGVYGMLEAALPRGVLFRTDQNMGIPRGGDHIHPTKHGADIWADTLMLWVAKSTHPILTQKPDSGTTTKGHKFIYLHPND